MADIYPDIMGEYISTPQRYVADGVQYGGHFDPATLPPGQASNLYLFLQNTLNVPVNIGLQIEIPKTSGLFRGGKPLLEIGAETIQLSLKAAEAGVITLPVLTTEHFKSGEQALTVMLKAKPTGKGQRIRPPQSQSKLDSKLIDDPVGLSLVSAIGATYVEKSVKKALFPLKVAGESQQLSQKPRLQHQYQSMWDEDHLDLFKRASREIDLRQNKFKEELSDEALYVALYSESTSRFADVGLPLRIGEAITLAKILTYSCRFFLNNSIRRKGLLVPIWERALDADFDTADPVNVLRIVGYDHILRLAIAMSFGMVAQAVGRQPWTLTERQAVAHHVVENVKIGQTTEEDFLYLPLLMGGTLISSRVMMHGEQVQHSLALLEKAYHSRSNLFADEEMAQAKNIYDRILRRARQASS
jgi:hypothetical protein